MPWASLILPFRPTVVVAACLVWTVASAATPRRGGEELERTAPGILKSFVREVVLDRRQVPFQPLRPGLRLNFGDRLRTLTGASAEVFFSNQDVLTLWEKSMLEIRRGPGGSLAPAFLAGQGRVNSVGPDHPLPINTPHATITHRFTEFVVMVHDQGTEVQVLDGDAELANEFGRQTIRRGERAIARPGQAPELLPVLPAHRRLQWWIYYPAVLDPNSPRLANAAAPDLRAARESYARGNLVSALHAWPGFPDPRPPADPAEALLLGALWLGVGHVDHARAALESVPVEDPERRALERLLRLTTSEPPLNATPLTSSEWLARSYEDQAAYQLDRALAAADRALQQSPAFGFAMARRAELLFALGRLEAARQAAEEAAAIVPEHAEVLVTQGFTALARNQFDRAEALFGEALERQSRLGDAWLGLALVHWRRGRTEEALEDFRLAVGSEPERSLVRSYLGKALADSGNSRVARDEFRRARETDPFDPTPWLYEALLDRAENRLLEARSNLNRAQALNAERAVFRGRHLLDQDRAVRSANLAGIHFDLGLDRMAETEGARAVAADYGDYSAHAFLATTYNQLRDPRQGDLRYETPWFSEYLTANLLAPPGAGILSQAVSQNEYSRLLQRDGPGLVSETSYASRGAWRQAASQFGTFAGTEYAVDALYLSDPGPAANRDIEHLTLSTQVKQQLGPRDSFFLQAIRYEAEGGDTSPSFDGHPNHPGLRFEESQEPLVLLGHRHDWSPDARSLVLATLFDSHLEVTNSRGAQYLAIYDPALGSYAHLLTNSIEWGRTTDFRGGSLEGQHLQAIGSHQVTLGARYQGGSFPTESSYYQPRLLRNVPVIGGVYRSQLDPQDINPGFQRWTGYLYDAWEIDHRLTLTAGLTYDWLEQPLNFQSSPVIEGSREMDQWSPSAGLILAPWTNGVFRAAWARALGGVSFDQSLRLEPVQVAGFIHGWRGLMPDTIAAQSMEIAALAYDHAFPTDTLLSLEFRSASSSADPQLGLVAVESRSQESASLVTEDLDYRQNRVRASLHQLLGRQWVIGVQYEYSETALHRALREHDQVASHEEADLHRLVISGRWFHPGGLFAEIEGVGIWQTARLEGWPDLEVDHWVVNAYLGWRGWQRRFEIVAGVANLTDTEDPLAPLSGLPEGLGERTAVLTLRFQF